MNNTQRGAGGSTDRQLTRSEVAIRLGISVSAVRRMEGKTLHPFRDDRGILRFAVSELPEARKATSSTRTSAAPRVTQPDAGEIAARVFEALAAGYSLRQIVTSLRVEPARVRKLFAEWHVDLVAGERARRETERTRADAREERAWTA
jgi:hypothetical protein